MECKIIQPENVKYAEHPPPSLTTCFGNEPRLLATCAGTHSYLSRLLKLYQTRTIAVNTSGQTCIGAPQKVISSATGHFIQVIHSKHIIRVQSYVSLEVLHITTEQKRRECSEAERVLQIMAGNRLTHIMWMLFCDTV